MDAQSNKFLTNKKYKEQTNILLDTVKCLEEE